MITLHFGRDIQIGSIFEVSNRIYEVTGFGDGMGKLIRLPDGCEQTVSFGVTIHLYGVKGAPTQYTDCDGDPVRVGDKLIRLDDNKVEVPQDIVIILDGESFITDYAYSYDIFKYTAFAFDNKNDPNQITSRRIVGKNPPRQHLVWTRPSSDPRRDEYLASCTSVDLTGHINQGKEVKPMAFNKDKKLFWVTVIQHPTPNEVEKGIPPKVIVEATQIYATDQLTAVVQVDLPENCNRNQLEVIVRDF